MTYQHTSNTPKLSSNHFNRFVGLSSSLAIALTGLGTIAQAAWAESRSDRVLLAQQIVDGLPPPPAASFDNLSLPPAQLQPIQPGSFDAPLTPSPSFDSFNDSSGETDQRYLVLVNGDSPLLLEQVRKIESGAFLQNYDGRRVIQAGSFVEPTRAEQQVQALETQGIGAEIIPIADSELAPTPTPQIVSALPSSTLPPPELLPASPAPNREVIFGQQPTFDSTPGSGTTFITTTSPYYVVIPGRELELPNIGDQVVRLGEGFSIAGVVEERQSPLGPHVLVGPFANRRAAARWNRYFRGFGLDARVYYRRR